MSTFETKDNSGALFTNTKKNEKHPDFKGKCRVNGVDMEVAVWQKTSAKGTQYMSMSFSEPWVNPNAEERTEAKPYVEPFSSEARVESPSNDLPF